MGRVDIVVPLACVVGIAAMVFWLVWWASADNERGIEECSPGYYVGDVAGPSTDTRAIVCVRDGVYSVKVAR